MPRPPDDLQGPSAPKNRPDRDPTVPRAADGTYELTLKSIRDRGVVEDRFGDSKPTLRITVTGDKPEGGDFILSRDVTHSYDPRSIICLLGEAILGVDPKDPEAELNYPDLVDGVFLGQVTSREYHPRVDGEPDASVTHYFTEWKGAPMAVPGRETKAPTPEPPSQPDQQPKAVADDWTPAWEGQPLHSSISEPVWIEVAPVLRQAVEYFGDSILDMFEYLSGDLGNGFNSHAEVVLSFFRERGPADVVFTASGKTDTHAADLKLSLHAFVSYWKSGDSDGDSPDDDLPF